MKTKRTNKLLIFDFDGVLVNTELTTFKFYQELLPKYNIYLKDEDLKYKIGRKSIDFFRDVLKDSFNDKLVDELITNKREAFLKDIKKYLTPLPHVFELLEALQNADFAMAIGSQNERPLIDKSLDTFGFGKYFQFTTSLQDISHKKPDPEVFLLVTNTLGFSPMESVIIEDSPHGIEAARVIDAQSVGITTSFTRKQLKAANLVIDSLSELTPEILRSL